MPTGEKLTYTGNRIYAGENLGRRLHLLATRVTAGEEGQRTLKGSFPEQRVAPLLATTPDVEKIRTLSRVYPEMSQLATDVAASPETGTASTTKTLGEQILGLPRDATKEFDRTATSLLNLSQVLSGDYAGFTACQDEATKLKPESFDALQAYTRKVLGYNQRRRQVNPEKLDAMSAILVINDLGKINSVVAEVERRTGKKEQDHDAVLLTVLKDYPFMSPSFQRLSAHERKVTKQALTPNFNIGQLIQGENVPASLNGLSKMNQEALDFYLLHAVFDIAGARGQFVQNGSAVMTEQTWQGFQKAIGAIEGLAKGQKPEQAYTSFLNTRAEQLGFAVNSPETYAVARVACMMRLATPEEAQTVAQVFAALPDQTRVPLQQELTMTGTNDGTAILPYYAPALLTNIRRTLEQGHDTNALQTSAEIGLQVLANVYEKTRQTIANKKGNGIYTVDIASLAKRASENPRSLLTNTLTITPSDTSAKMEVA